MRLRESTLRAVHQHASYQFERELNAASERLASVAESISGSEIIGQLEEEQMHPTPIERMKLALRALPSHDSNANALAPSELERLKSWFEGDSTGMSAAQVAREVIQQEMDKQKKARVRSASG